MKRTLTPVELVNTAGTRGDPLRVIELLPGVARPPGLAGFLIIRGSSPFDSQAFFEGGIVDRIYHFGGLTSFVNPRLLDHIDLYPGNFSARFGRKMGGIIDVGIRDPEGRRASRDGRRQPDRRVLHRRGPGRQARLVRPRRQAQLHRLLVQQRRPAGRHRRHRRARLLRLPGGLHVPPRERREGPDDVPRLGRRVPPEPEAARRRRSDAAGQLRRRHRRSAACRRPGSARWARTSSRTSPPASGRSTQDLAAGDQLGLPLQRLRPVPARRVARPARLARQADRRLRRLRPPGRRRLRRAASRSRPKATRATSPARSPACRRRRSRAGSRPTVPPATSRRWSRRATG